MISPKARELIESKLELMLRSGKRIERIRLMVCPFSAIAKLSSIETGYGSLKIVRGEHIPKGYSYLIEKPLSRGGIGFMWVSKKISPPASVGERPPAS